jgi:serine/tyrosine/threonine adenylyltransferase
MTEFFRKLAEVDLSNPSTNSLHNAFYVEEKFQQFAPEFGLWLTRYATRVIQDGEAAEQRIKRMNEVNPRYVLRNYLAQEAIDKAEQGDNAMIHELLEMLRSQCYRAAHSEKKRHASAFYISIYYFPPSGFAA